MPPVHARPKIALPLSVQFFLEIPPMSTNYSTRFESVRDAGHYGYLEQTDAFTDRIEAFLGA